MDGTSAGRSTLGFAVVPRLRVVALWMLLAGSASASATASRDIGLRLDLPAGFRPVPAAVARRGAGPLVSLLRQAGVSAATALRARQDLLGTPQAPQATFTAARVRVRTTSLAAVPELLRGGLKAALRSASALYLEPTLLEPRARSVAGRQGFELGWSQALADGRSQLRRILFLPRGAEVLVLSLTAVGRELAPLESLWAQSSASFTLEAASTSADFLLWPALPLTLAALALAIALLRRRRARPSTAWARHDALHQVRTHNVFRDGRGEPTSYLPPAAPAPRPAPSIAPLAAALPRPPCPPTPPSHPPTAPAPLPASGGSDPLALIDATRNEGGMSLLELKLARQQAAQPPR